MSETNGTPKPEWMQRLDRVEASHVKLMADSEVFWHVQEQSWAEHAKFVAEQERAWAEHKEFVAEQDVKWKEQGERIDKLVSAIGVLIAEQRAKRNE